MIVQKKEWKKRRGRKKFMDKKKKAQLRTKSEDDEF